MLPETFEPLLRRLSVQFPGDDYIFPAGKTTPRERIEEPELYELLQHEIPVRLLQLTPG